MKFVFSFLLLLSTLQVFSRTVITGSGSGSVILKDMSGLKPGDTLAIRAGNYESGGSFFNLTGITIVNFSGVVNFGKSVSLGNLVHVKITGSGWKEALYGFRFVNLKTEAFQLEAPCRSFSLDFCEYRDVIGSILNASRFLITYTGDSSTLALYRTSISHQKLVHSGALFVGSWAANASFQNVVDSIAFLHIIIDSTSSDVCQVLGHSVYRMLASHWRVTGPCPNGKHDAGIFQTSGNGTVSNVYRKDGWGYIWRIWNVGLNGRADSYLFNCIDLNTDNYGTIDTRIEPGDTTTGNRIPFLRGGSMHILNNTIGNKRTINYVSQLVIAGNFCSANGYQLEVRNNLCFNTVATGADPVIKQNTGDKLLDTSNNIYTQDPIESGILMDTIECILNPEGPAVDAARSYPFITSDIDGVPRPAGKAADIGARESADISVTTYPSQGRLPKKWLFTGLGAILMILIVITARKRAAGKDPGNRVSFSGRG